MNVRFWFERQRLPCTLLTRCSCAALKANSLSSLATIIICKACESRRACDSCMRLVTAKQRVTHGAFGSLHGESATAIFRTLRVFFISTKTVRIRISNASLAFVMITIVQNILLATLKCMFIWKISCCLTIKLNDSEVQRNWFWQRVSGGCKTSDCKTRECVRRVSVELRGVHAIALF